VVNATFSEKKKRERRGTRGGRGRNQWSWSCGARWRKTEGKGREGLLKREKGEGQSPDQRFKREVGMEKGQAGDEV